MRTLIVLALIALFNQYGSGVPPWGFAICLFLAGCEDVFTFINKSKELFK